MKLLFLGTGAAGGVTGNPLGNPNIRRCSSTLVDGDLLLDPGPHIFDFAEQYGNPDLYAGVRYILCTHSHPDHFCPETVEKLIAINPDLVMYGDEAIRRKLTRLLPEVATKVNFVPLTHGQWIEFGEYRVLPTHSNHSTGDPIEVTLHHTVEKGGKRLFYGLDGAWLLYDEVIAIQESHPDLVVLDGTLGEKIGDERVFGHNDLAMVRLLKAALAPSAKRFCITHMSRKEHKPHAELAADMARDGIEVAFDGMEMEI